MLSRLALLLLIVLVVSKARLALGKQDKEGGEEKELNILQESEQLAEEHKDDCDVTDWSEWSECSTTCGLGFRYRNRFFLHPNMKADGHGLSHQDIPEKCQSVHLVQKSACSEHMGIQC